MKLEKYQVTSYKKRKIITFIVCCVFLIAVVFSWYQKIQNFNFINGNVEDSEDVYFALYVDDVVSSSIPAFDSGYILDTEKSYCNNGVTISWDTENQSISINFSNFSLENNSRTKCTLYFKEKISFSQALSKCNNTAAICFQENANTDTVNLAYDATQENNLRYIGANPNNYVSFNNELWRIIGVMNHVDDGTGKKESRLKIVRSESIGTYSFNNGSNGWNDAALNEVLNEGAYWNRTSGNCPKYSSAIDHSSVSCDFSNIGLTNDSKQLIQEAVWHLGSVSSNENTALQFYEFERELSSSTKTTWTGVVGLIYPSDFGFSFDSSKNECQNILLSTSESCADFSYLNSSDIYYTLTPGKYVYRVTSFGINDTAAQWVPYSIFPSVYLSSAVMITGGDGSSNFPYTLSI